MKVEGFSYRKTPGAPVNVPVWRFYGTREVFRYPDGTIRPQPGSWELVTEFKIRDARGRVTLPAFELEPTRIGGWRFYNLVLVDAEGRETWHADNEILFPPEMIEEFGGSVDVATLMLYNLELKGVIAPGQLND